MRNKLRQIEKFYLYIWGINFKELQINENGFSI